MNEETVEIKRESFYRRNQLPILSFILTVIILETAYASRGIFPFGPKDLLVVDLYHQYVPFLSELQHKLSTYSSLFYSWSGGLGTDFYATYAYYLASPLNVLLLLFPNSFLTEAVLVLTLIKFGLSGAFFSIFLEKAYGRKDLTVVAFSMMYALSGYALAYSWNIMWLEGIYLMPLIFLGLIRLVKDGKALLYTITMGLLLFSNFYISFFIVLFTVLYYPIVILQFLPEKNIRTIALKTVQTALFSILAVGLAAIMILPTVSALKLTSASGEIFPRELTEYFNLFDYIGRHFPTMKPVIREGLPNIYCGISVLMLVPAYFLSSRFSRAEKVAHGLMILLLIISFNLNVLNFIWHGFHFPNQLPFRNSLVYVFFMVVLSFRAMEAKEEFTNKQWIGILGIIGILLLLVQKFNDKVPGFPDIYVIFLIMGTFAVVFTLKNDRPDSALRFTVFFLLAVTIELTASTLLTIDKLDNNEYYSTRSGYLTGGDVKDLKEQIGKIEKSETSFYRMEVMQPKTPNDGYLYGYNGVSIFSSMMPKKVVGIMENFGFHTNSINSYKYEGSTLPLDSMLGVKYLIRRNNSNITETLKSTLYKKGNLSVYKNPYAVSLGYIVPKKMKDWKSYGNSAFSVQNSFIEGLSGVRDIFSDIKVETGSTINLTVSRVGSHGFSYTRNDKSRESRLTVNITGTDDKNAYLYLDTRTNKIDSGYVMVGDKRIDFNAKRSTVADIGFCGKDKPVSLELTFKGDSDTDGNLDVYAAVLNETNFKQADDVVKKNSMQVEKFKDTYVEGTVNAAEAGVLFTTIPYHKGWSVKVDGKDTATYAIDDGFLAFDISQGAHTIQLSYMTPYFLLGAGITGISLVILLLGNILLRKVFR